MMIILFQSSRSLRTATQTHRMQIWSCRDFNPRGPCGPRHGRRLLRLPGSKFQSSRSLRTATAMSAFSSPRPVTFQSSRSLRTATAERLKLEALREAFQSSRSLRTATCVWELPRQEERLFQSSRSLRTATAKTHKRSAASLYKAENILSAPKSFLREGRKNQRLPSPSPCVFRCEPARERPGAWPSH